MWRISFLVRKCVNKFKYKIFTGKEYQNGKNSKKKFIDKYRLETLVEHYYFFLRKFYEIFKN